MKTFEITYNNAGYYDHYEGGDEGGYIILRENNVIVNRWDVSSQIRPLDYLKMYTDTLELIYVKRYNVFTIQ
jgi:hypothetical protein